VVAGRSGPRGSDGWADDAVLGRGGDNSGDGRGRSGMYPGATLKVEEEWDDDGDEVGGAG
jgi:hypothetical protein